MAALAGLADATARGMRGDGVDGESIARRGAVAIHACGGEGCVGVGRDGVVIRAGEAESHAVVADVALPIAADLACATGHARVRRLL